MPAPKPADEPPASDVAAQFLAIAADIAEDRSPDTLQALFAKTRAACRAAASRERVADRAKLLTDVQEALETWDRVWPRLGSQREFRLAVGREARLWAKRFSAS